MENMTKKILFISQTILLKNTGGGLVSEKTLDLLTQTFDCVDVLLLGDKNISFSFNNKVIDFRTKYSKRNTFLNHLLGLSTGINLCIYYKIKQLLKKEQYDVIFFDSSVFGRITRYAKKHTNSKLITYYHNIEADFSKDFYKHGGLPYYPIYRNAVYNEKLASKYTDYIFLINKEEETRLNLLYNRKIDLCLPVSLNYDGRATNFQKMAEKLNILFVGSNFFANIEGITWFIKNVMPHIDAGLTIVGKGMEQSLVSFSSDKIKVLGYVNNLAEVYAQHQIVIVPIFSGAGMKVKIAEAFSYGKYVLTTDFAFSGYEKQEGIATICDNARQFIEAINSYPVSDYFLPEAVNYFQKYYSQKAVLLKLKQFVEEIL